jgi:hypothetical protein
VRLWGHFRSTTRFDGVRVAAYESDQLQQGAKGGLQSSLAALGPALTTQQSNTPTVQAACVCSFACPSTSLITLLSLVTAVKG